MNFVSPRVSVPVGNEPIASISCSHPRYAAVSCRHIADRASRSARRGTARHAQARDARSAPQHHNHSALRSNAATHYGDDLNGDRAASGHSGNLFGGSCRNSYNPSTPTPRTLAPRDPDPSVPNLSPVGAMGEVRPSIGTASRPMSGPTSMRSESSFYDMLTGAPPTQPRRKIPSRSLEAIVDRCLAPDPSKRWPSAADVCRQLGQVRGPRDVKAK
jgi:serine/threonine protein kinase